MGESVLLRFVITQHFKDEQLMKNLIEYFGCGNLYKKNERVLDFVVSKLSDINKIIIPFFSKYPLEGEKYKDFIDFCKIAELMGNKAHLTKEGLDQIRSIKSQMNTARDSSASGISNSITLSRESLSGSDDTSFDTSDKLTNSSKDIDTEPENSTCLVRK